MRIDGASVKVMRSHDYCHFEICLTASESVGRVTGVLSSESVDELRKTAARLADKAVEQYKVAKENAERLLNDERERERFSDRVTQIQSKPEAERTPKEKAFVKAMEDRLHRNRPRYDYEDDWEEEEWQEVETDPADDMF